LKVFEKKHKWRVLLKVFEKKHKWRVLLKVFEKKHKWGVLVKLKFTKFFFQIIKNCEPLNTIFSNIGY
jgi:hypothetical protein